jgi:cell division cycle 20-like protein 1 (cofactor of APC complex)
MDKEQSSKIKPVDEENNPCTVFIIAVSTPKKQKYDRFITTPGGTSLISKFNFLSNEKKSGKRKRKSEGGSEGDSSKRDESRNQIYKDVLINEILPDASPIRSSDNGRASRLLNFSSSYNASPTKRSQLSPFECLSTSRLTMSSQKALQTPKKLIRYISKAPYKVLDAPELQVAVFLT